MARLADYFIVVGYDQDKSGKSRCVCLEECCDLFRPLATTIHCNSAAAAVQEINGWISLSLTSYNRCQ